MSRFAYLIDTWPDVYEILKDAEEKLYYDSNITLIKLRQAVEIIVKKILESEENFDQVELVELIDKLDTIDYLNRNFNNKLTNLFHEIRKYGNKAAHEGYKDDELAKYFLDELKDILFQIKKIIKGDNTDYEKNFINPFTFNCNVSIEEELRESKNWFERGVFETKEEFYQRIKNHEGIKIGKIYLEKVEPIITEKIAAFPFSIYKIDETIKFPEIKFIYMNKNDYNDLPKNSSDFEIYSKLDVVNEEVVIDIENTYIFVNKKKYKVNVLVLDSNWYESKDKFKETINRLDPIPIGIVKIKMNEYDIETEKLPIKIEEYYWMSNFFNQKKGYIKIDRNSAKILCKENIIFNLIGKLICWEDSIKVKRCYIESKEFNTSIIINLEKEDNILGYIEQAELGNKEAIYKIGELYFEGEGVEQDYTKAYEWYKKAAELG
ncbi:tetratricopeptide repeat protein, partial [Anaerobranca gottschalkii]